MAPQMCPQTVLDPTPGEPCAQASALDLLIGRRINSRHPLDLSARFIFAGANVRVQLEDISASGAAFRLMHPQTLDAGRLCWLGFEMYGEPVWQSEARCGLLFAERLTPDCLRQTLEFGAMARDKGDKFLRLASAWAYGPGDY